MPGPVPDPDFVRQVLVRGDTWCLEVEIVDSNPALWDWGCQWRTEPSSPDVFAEADVDLSHAVDGYVTFTIGADVTGEITPPAVYYWDVHRIQGGVVETVVAGRTDIAWDVTR